eukprot:UN00810
MSTRQAPQNFEEYKALLKSSLKRAFGGGLAGASAMALQVLTLMWARTIMNYQYRHGTTFRVAAKTLYAEGGIPRFYKGMTPALLQGPLSRFGDTAANAGMLAFLQSIPLIQDLPVGPRTMIMTSAASFGAGMFRILLTPIDTFKTVLQVEGAKGLPLLKQNIQAHGIPVFFHGALASAAATMAGHFPWFTTYNYLSAKIPEKKEDKFYQLSRSAGIGFTSSVISDTVSNSIRVVKTYRQTHAEKVSYPTAVKEVIAKDGVIGLMGRGLKTRIAANGLQGLLFSVLWKYFDDKFKGPSASNPVPKA